MPGPVLEDGELEDGEVHEDRPAEMEESGEASGCEGIAVEDDVTNTRNQQHDPLRASSSLPPPPASTSALAPMRSGRLPEPSLSNGGVGGTVSGALKGHSRPSIADAGATSRSRGKVPAEGTFGGQSAQSTPPVPQQQSQLSAQSHSQLHHHHHPQQQQQQPVATSAAVPPEPISEREAEEQELVSLLRNLTRGSTFQDVMRSLEAVARDLKQAIKKLDKLFRRVKRRKGDSIEDYPECFQFSRRILEGLHTINKFSQTSAFQGAPPAATEAARALFKAAMNYRHDIFNPALKQELETLVRNSKAFKSVLDNRRSAANQPLSPQQRTPQQQQQQPHQLQPVSQTGQEEPAAGRQQTPVAAAGTGPAEGAADGAPVDGERGAAGEATGQRRREEEEEQGQQEQRQAAAGGPEPMDLDTGDEAAAPPPPPPQQDAGPESPGTGQHPAPEDTQRLAPQQQTSPGQPSLPGVQVGGTARFAGRNAAATPGSAGGAAGFKKFKIVVASTAGDLRGQAPPPPVGSPPAVDAAAASAGPVPPPPAPAPPDEPPAKRSRFSAVPEPAYTAPVPALPAAPDAARFAAVADGAHRPDAAAAAAAAAAMVASMGLQGGSSAPWGHPPQSSRWQPPVQAAPPGDQGVTPPPESPVSDAGDDDTHTDNAVRRQQQHRQRGSHGREAEAPLPPEPPRAAKQDDVPDGAQGASVPAVSGGALSAGAAAAAAAAAGGSGTAKAEVQSAGEAAPQAGDQAEGGAGTAGASGATHAHSHSDRERDRDRDRDKDRERDRSNRDRDRDRGKDRDRDREKDRDRERDRDRDRDRDRHRSSKDKERDKERDKDHGSHRSSTRHRDRDKDRDRDGRDAPAPSGLLSDLHGVKPEAFDAADGTGPAGASWPWAGTGPRPGAGPGVAADEVSAYLARGRLVLVVDLDTVTADSCWESQLDGPAVATLARRAAVESGALPEERRELFRLMVDAASGAGVGGGGSGPLWLKLRPGARAFLSRASERYELWAHTRQGRMYADAVVELLDPSQSLFGSRVVAQGELAKRLLAVLDARAPIAAVLDSPDAGWMGEQLAGNLLGVPPYGYFANRLAGAGAAVMSGRSLLEMDRDECPERGMLAAALPLLERLHSRVLNAYSAAGGPNRPAAANPTSSSGNPPAAAAAATPATGATAAAPQAAAHEGLESWDVRRVLRSLREHVLAGTHITFSRLLSGDSQAAAAHPLWRLAEACGAMVSTQVTDHTTHVVSLSAGTEKAIWAQQRGRFVVSPSWLECSCYMWRKADEALFLVA